MASFNIKDNTRKLRLDSHFQYLLTHFGEHDEMRWKENYRVRTGSCALVARSHFLWDKSFELACFVLLFMFSSWLVGVSNPFAFSSQAGTLSSVWLVAPFHRSPCTGRTLAPRPCSSLDQEFHYNLPSQIIITDEDTFVRVVGSGGGASVRAVDVRVVVVGT